MTRKVFVQIPSNQPSGGIKVANQLANLFREHGYESYVVLPYDVYQANWLVHPAPVINFSRMNKICEERDIIIDNSNDKVLFTQTMQSKARIKVYYAQGCSFNKTSDTMGDDFLRNSFGYTHYWAVSNDSLKYLTYKYPRIKKWYLVSPYFEFDVVRRIIKEKVEREDKILCLPRKGKTYIWLAQFLFKDKIEFNVIDRFTEKEGYELMASCKFFLSTAIGVDRQHIRNIVRFFKYGSTKYNYSVVIPPGHNEGFNLPPAEAAMCGSIVIGFAMGGGLEWMAPDTCFLAKDRSYFSLIKRIREALSASDEEIDTMRENAFMAVSKFNKNNTWKQIEEFLSDLGD